MRLHAAKDGSNWFVWHCEKCYRPMAVWVDDETNCWGEYAPPPTIVERQAKKIVIDLGARTILINPVDDHSVDETLREVVLIEKPSTMS